MHQLVRVILGIAFASASFTYLTAQAVPGRSANRTDASWPAARGSHGMTYDEKRGLTLVYGDRGAEAKTLWGWDGTRWHAFDAPGPGLRRHIKLAYDASRDRTVLFSGLDDTQTQPGDTWEWDGAAWHRVATDGPEPRGSYSLAYDPRRKRVLLFGGLSQQSGTMGDTWEWDGRAWTKMADTGPSPRGEAGAAYDARTGTIVIAGGTTWAPQTFSNGRTGWTSAPASEWPRDTWSWDGTAWRKLSDDGLSRFGAIVPAPITGRPLRVAGQSDTALHGDLLAWTGSAWTAVDAPPIPARFFHEAALDTRRKRLVVFGGSMGQGAVSDLWEWDGTAWNEITRPASVPAPAAAPRDRTLAAPRPLYSTAADFDAARGRLVVFGGFGRGGYSGETWEWDGSAWQQIPIDGPSPRNSPAMVFDSRRNVMVLFGGDTRAQVFGDTWEYDGRTWTRVSERGPEPRSTHRLAYDSRRGRVVLFGGFRREEGGRMVALDDTWEWDGTAWTRAATTGPSGRTLQAMAYDPSIGKVVLFGGGVMTDGPSPTSGAQRDTWEWDGARWTQAAGPAPPARDHVAMTYDGAAGRLVLFGGSGIDHARLGDFWQRKGSAWEPAAMTGMPPRAGHHVIYDTRGRRLLIFAGFGPSSREAPGGPTAEIWAQSGDRWVLLTPAPPAPLPATSGPPAA